MERSRPILNVSLIICFLFSVICRIGGSLVHKRFEYQFSFKPPYLAQRDGSVPFWEYGGNTIPSSENVRIAPSLRSQKGGMWTKSPVPYDWWEVDIAFRVSGRGRIGADGLAFWYTQNKGSYEGDVFGSSDQWVGLGVFFDSFDNDNRHNNPYVSAMVNDGTKQFDHQNDGGSHILAGCLKDFRNKPYPTRARIEYHNNVLTILFHNGMTTNQEDFELCLRAENVVLPKNGYFGVSAATGGLADDHDVIHFLTSSLSVPGQQIPGQQQPSDEQKKLTEEYQEYQRKLEQQKEEYLKEHPEAKKDKDSEWDEWFESDNQRELRQIFQGQSQMFDALRELNRKLDEIVGRQERTMSLVSMQHQAGGVQPSGTQQQQGVPSQAYSDTIRRHEVDAIINNQNLLINTLREVRQAVADVQARSDRIINNQAQQPTAQVQAVGYDMQSLVSEMRDGLNHVKANFAQKPATATCPTVSCVSVTSVLVVAVVQLVIILGYQIYRDNKDSSAKKFY